MTHVRSWAVVGLVLAVLVFAGIRVVQARASCIASGGSYELTSLSCTGRPPPIILQRGILRT